MTAPFVVTDGKQFWCRLGTSGVRMEMLTPGTGTKVDTMPSKTEPQIAGPWDTTGIGSIPELEPGTVHLWQTPLEDRASEVTAWYELLSRDEQDRALRFREGRPRNDFVVTRGTLRALLARYLGTAPQEVHFCYAIHGKPLLGGNSNLCFNVSHTRGLAMMAVAQDRAIGVDVENVNRDTDVKPLAERFFSESERQALRHLSGQELRAAFSRCWTRKEAYIKAKGDGLALPLSQFDVSIAAGDRNALLATRPDRGEASQWTISDVPVIAEYAAAVAVSAD
jgi:4'-phosphopantetheinyl transferase